MILKNVIFYSQQQTLQQSGVEKHTHTHTPVGTLALATRREPRVRPPRRLKSNHNEEDEGNGREGHAITAKEFEQVGGEERGGEGRPTTNHAVSQKIT